MANSHLPLSPPERSRSGQGDRYASNPVSESMIDQPGRLNGPLHVFDSGYKDEVEAFIKLSD